MSEREIETKLNVGLKQSYRKLVEQHRRDNQPLIFSENGVVQYVDPFTVEYNKKESRNSLSVNQLGLEPRTPSLKGMCSTC